MRKADKFLPLRGSTALVARLAVLLIVTIPLHIRADVLHTLSRLALELTRDSVLEVALSSPILPHIEVVIAKVTVLESRGRAGATTVLPIAWEDLIRVAARNSLEVATIEVVEVSASLHIVVMPTKWIIHPAGICGTDQAVSDGGSHSNRCPRRHGIDST